MSKTDPKVTVEKVVVEQSDPAEAEQKARKSAADKHAATLRAEHVTALETELAFLERLPNPSASRVAGVKAELSHYSKKPTERRIETATPAGAPAAAKKTAPAKAVETPEKG